ncbi:MAG TPA: TadE family protein [Bryobacteraceae bacterium]|nr:TadE family protein [Bryobacteraceae bacterium]
MSLPPHFRPLRPRLSVTKRPAEKGQVFIESAIITIPLMFLIFGLIDTSLALWVRATLEHAALAFARCAITYRLDPGVRIDASHQNLVK